MHTIYPTINCSAVIFSLDTKSHSEYEQPKIPIIKQTKVPHKPISVPSSSR